MGALMVSLSPTAPEDSTARLVQQRCRPVASTAVVAIDFLSGSMPVALVAPADTASRFAAASAAAAAAAGGEVDAEADVAKYAMRGAKAVARNRLSDLRPAVVAPALSAAATIEGPEVVLDEDAEDVTATPLTARKYRAFLLRSRPMRHCRTQPMMDSPDWIR